MRMRRSARASAFLSPLLLAAAPLWAQQGEAGEALADLRSARFTEAIAGATATLDRTPADEAARRTLVRALIETGQLEEAVARSDDLNALRGEALLALGRDAEAEDAYRREIEAGGADRWPAEVALGGILFHRGDREEAFRRFDRLIELYNGSSRLGAADLIAVSTAVRFLGLREPHLFRDAVKALDEATRQDSGDAEPHIRMAELFIEKYNGSEAHAAIQDAVRIADGHPRATLALARLHAFEGNRVEAFRLVRSALEANPALVPARVFLARMYLDGEAHGSAEAELRSALEVNPRSLDALSMLAAVHYVRDESAEYERIRAEVSALNPRYAGLLTTVAEIAANHRRYPDAARLAAEATRIDPESWPAHSVLGLNEFRLGRIDEARAALETAFAGDPYDVWIKNNLDLLDTFDQYELRSVPGFEFMLHRDEADLLYPYLVEAATEAHRELTERYGDTSARPVRIELYPRSADFSVRTVGLAGLGALGVSFGDVVAMDSPGARQAGSYNWLTTLWHELAHTVALSVSEHRVPRWFTEGLSVREERWARPGWVASTPPELLLMYGAGELPPVSRLNEGFIRPRSPRHLSGAYQLAALAVEWIEETRGFDAVIGILHAYRDGFTGDEVFRQALGLEPPAADEEFDAWLLARATPAQAEEFMRLLSEGMTEFRSRNFTESRRLLERATTLFPIALSGSPYEGLSRIHLEEGDDEAALAALAEHASRDQTAYRANLELARRLDEAGDIAGAATALERAVWIFPYEPAPHLRLAELYDELGEFAGAVRERRAVLGLRPTDRASALYQLALALDRAGDRREARREVLRALDLAPAYAEAQALLLRLHEDN